MSKDIVCIYAENDIIQISEIKKVNRFFKRLSFEFSIAAKENAKIGQTTKLFIKFSDANTQYIPISIIDS